MTGCFKLSFINLLFIVIIIMSFNPITSSSSYLYTLSLCRYKIFYLLTFDFILKFVFLQEFSKYIL